MKPSSTYPVRLTRLLVAVLLFLESPHRLLAEPSAAAVNAFNLYSRTLETRLAQQHRTAGAFLAPVARQSPQTADTRLRAGELIIEQLTPANAEVSGALLHHWRGTAFAPGATAADFERLIRDFNGYPQHFAPEVTEARVLRTDGDSMSASMRVRQHHVITVVMDTSYDIRFGQLDRQHGYSISESTAVSEIDGSGHPLSAEQEHGFLWRLNTYWSYEERDGGLYLQIESISLTRAIPRGLGWAVRPYVESIPKESLEFTLRSAVNAVHRDHH